VLSSKNFARAFPHLEAHSQGLHCITPEDTQPHPTRTPSRGKPTCA